MLKNVPEPVKTELNLRQLDTAILLLVAHREGVSAWKCDKEWLGYFQSADNILLSWLDNDFEGDFLELGIELLNHQVG